MPNSQLNCFPSIAPLTNLDARLIHQMVEAQVLKTPDAIAVEFADVAINYADLNRRANHLAHYLQDQGVRADSLVGVSLERSIDLIVALLAILKAGAGYLPLDMAYPSDRLNYMLDQAQAPILLTQAHLADRFSTQADVLLLDQFDWTLADRDSENPTSNATPNDLAYVIYTSGSTGNPKGVAMPHLPLWNLLEWQQQSLIGAARTLQFTPISFDVSFQEIFGTLTTGGTLVLISEAVRQDPESLLTTLVEAKIERLFLPFVALRQLAEVGCRSTQVPAALRDVITAGEQLRVTSAIVTWFQRLTPAALHNHYGPSETHVITALTLQGDPGEWEALPSIGQAITHCQTLVLDDQFQPVPDGTVGELYLSGLGLARGYLHRPDLTAERFLDQPGGDRYYKTGDLARVLPDGNIEYLGRADQQLKIRGYRIEPGEIETRLETHPDVHEAVVVGREDARGDLRLVGYVVPEVGKNPPASVLRQFVQATMPEYMVPSTIVRLTAFPTTPSGKVDRRALPAPTGIDREPNQTLIPPQDEIETKLVKIWEKLLEVNPIGVTDNFFDLGGHSLLITLLLIEIELLLARRLPVTIMFQAPTIRQLADIIRQQSDAEVQAPCVAFLPEGDQPPLFCIHGAKGNLMFCHGLGMYLDADRPVYGIQEPLRWRGWALPSRLEEIAAHYIDVMREVQPEGPYFIMGYCFGGVVAFEMAQQLTAQGETVGGVFLLDPDLPVTYSRIFEFLPQLAQVRGVPFLLRDLETHMLRLSKQTPIDACRYIVTELQKKVQKATPGRLMEKLRELSSPTTSPSSDSPAASPAAAVSIPNQASADINPDVYRFMNYHRAIVNYIPKFYPHPVTLLITETTYADFGLWGNWLQLAPCETKRLPGHHKSILREPDIQKLAEAIRDAID
jgi:amino acid adenylation domain-containing protein